eukprot:5463763-Pyramimonas_sp.AAC.1
MPRRRSARVPPLAAGQMEAVLSAFVVASLTTSAIQRRRGARRRLASAGSLEVQHQRAVHLASALELHTYIDEIGDSVGENSSSSHIHVAAGEGVSIGRSRQSGMPSFEFVQEPSGTHCSAYQAAQRGAR